MRKLSHIIFFTLWSLYSSCFYGLSIEQMTLEEKVGQLFIAYFDGENANEHAKRLICDMKIGGIIYYNFSNHLEDPMQVSQLSYDLQKLAQIPLFIAIDQEGGVVARLQKGFTEFPGNEALGRTHRPKLAYKASYYMGKELQSIGVNLNLAPVIDIKSTPLNPMTGVRSFGTTPKIVTKYAQHSFYGFKDAGIIPCLKHFPGDGDATIDSHMQLPIIEKSYEQLDNEDLAPFKALIDKAPVIMTAHILLPKIDPQNCATLSPILLQKIIREKLDFQGVLITDSLAMQGVLAGHKNLAEVALKALMAGNDILLIGGRELNTKTGKPYINGKEHIDEIFCAYQAILQAVRSGKISEKRIDASVERICRLKKESRLWKNKKFTPQEIGKILRNKKHQKIATKIAQKSLYISHRKVPKDFLQKKITIITPNLMKEKILSSDLAHLGHIITYDLLTPSLQEQKKILTEIESTDYVIFCSYNAWENPSQLNLLQTIAHKKPTICIALRDAKDLHNHPSIIKIATHSPTSCSLQVVTNWLQEKTP